nr:hypothetical protein CFP56_75512 [Quercus suber]
MALRGRHPISRFGPQGRSHDVMHLPTSLVQFLISIRAPRQGPQATFLNHLDSDARVSIFSSVGVITFGSVLITSISFSYQQHSMVQ